MADGDSRGIEWRSRIRLVDEVVEVVRDRIYEHHYPPGTPINQEQLAAELGVSRTPLREALRMLEQEGLVKASPGRGLRVISADLATLLEAYELREVVDGLAARLTAERGDAQTAAALAAALKAQRAAREPWNAAAYTAANVAFHRLIIEASKNAYVIAELPLVRMTSQVFTPIKLIDQSRASEAIKEHEAIAAAIVAGRGREAERLARRHIRGTIGSLRSRLRGRVEAC